MRHTHQQRYEVQVTAYVKRRGQTPDRNWRAFLWLATSLPNLWTNHVATFVDMPEGTVDFEAMLATPLSTGERRLLQAARSLYADCGEVDLSDLASLDDELWEAIVQGVSLYRGKSIN